eukprot:TRINITY_DN108845_c0_g1_i2.p1 TRINITY_DN108845_c0_g1~~TRINITY_DN108845_c0_g1_i2.p1  ORF type:complete len:194 (-),score=16.84 TRINITY_DN108845_c0_g1_i2:57-608(-)
MAEPSKEYIWSIRHGHLTEVPLEHTCPRLRAAHHVSYWGRENWMTFKEYPYRHFQSGTNTFATAAYITRAMSFIYAGMCSLRWGSSSEESLKQRSGERSHRSVGVNQTWRTTNLGFIDVQRDFCSHSLGLMEGTASMEARLLSRNFPVMTWTPEESAHCGPLQPERLLVEYRRLMAALIYIPE